jgi:LuxR family glucitol operon transcriptional activator
LQLSLIEQKGGRFFLLPLTQSYALEELAGRPELEKELREGWVARLTEMARPYAGIHWRTRDRRLLLQEGPHFATLATWSQQEMRPDILLQILPVLSLYYDTVGQWVDMISIGQIGLEYARLIGDQQSILFVEMNIFYWIAIHQDHYNEAERVIIDAIDISKQLGDVAWQCKALLRYSQILSRRNAFDRANECCQQALQLSDLLFEPQQTDVRANIEYELGRIARDRGDWRAAQTHFLTARDVFGYDDKDTTFNVERAWDIHVELGFVMHQLGDLTAAAQIYRQSLDFCREVGGKGSMTILLVRLATLEEQRGDHVAALDYAREALEWSNRLGMVSERAQAAAIVGRLNR